MSKKKRKSSRQRTNLRRLQQQFPERSVLHDLEASTEFLDAEHQGEEAGPKRFSMVAYNGGRLHVKNFPHPVVVNLRGLEAAKGFPILLDHKQHQRVGHSDSVSNDGRRLLIAGRLSAETEYRDEVQNSAKNGYKWQSSIGTHNKSIRFVQAGQTVRVNEREFTGPLFVILKATMRETSFVGVGGDEDKATATVHAEYFDDGPTKETDMKFKEWLKAQGFDHDSLSASQLAILQAAFDAEQEADDDEADESQLQAQAGDSSGGNASGNATTLQGQGIDLEAMRANIQQDVQATMQAEQQRVSGIQQLCAQFDNPEFTPEGASQAVTVEAHAMAEGWDLTQTELQCRRSSRIQEAPFGHSHSHAGTCTVEAMSGAFLMATGVNLDDEALTNSLEARSIGVPDFLRRDINDEQRDRFMNAAHQFSDMSLLDMCREAIRLDGQYVPHGRTEIIQAAFSGGTLANIFTTNLNVGILARFQQTVDTTMGWTKRNTNVPNFQPRDVVGMQVSGGLTKHARGGTADHATFADKGETYRIDRYSEQIAIDEMDIIDDNYSMFQEVRNNLADDCARLIPDLVFALLFANAVMKDGVTWFHASRGNLRTGKTLNATNLKEAITAFKTQQENGINLQLNSTHIITPEALEWTVDELLHSVDKREPSANGGMTKNPLRNKIRQPVHDARLDNGLTDPDTGTDYAGATGDWFLADGTRPPIEVGTLRGSGGVPRIRRHNLNSGQWGHGWDINHDAGAKGIRAETIQKNEE